MTAPRDPVDVAADARPLHDLAKKLGNALMQFTPGGSEYFIKIGDDYYADADACAAIIRRTISNLDELARAHIRRAKAAEEAIRSASNSGAEAMREAAARLLNGERVYERYLKWSFFDPEGDYRDTSDKAFFAQKAAEAIRDLSLPASGAPASPWRDMETAPRDATRFLICYEVASGRRVAEAVYCIEHGAPRWLVGGTQLIRMDSGNLVAWTDLPTPPATKDK